AAHRAHQRARLRRGSEHDQAPHPPPGSGRLSNAGSAWWRNRARGTHTHLQRRAAGPQRPAHACADRPQRRQTLARGRTLGRRHRLGTSDHRLQQIMNATAPPARLKTRYLDEIRPALIQRFGYSSPMQAPKLEKIVLNMGVGMAKQDSKALKAAQDQLATIAGQQPSVRRARKSIAAFKLREGMPVGLAVTLRAERG